MAEELKLPDMGEGIESGDVVQVHVSEGDMVAVDQTVAEVETDKAVLEVPSTLSGKVVKVHIKQGDKVQVGAVLLTVETGSAGDTEKSEAADEDKQPEPPPEKEQSEPPAKKAKPDKAAKKAEPAKEEVPAKPDTNKPREKEPKTEPPPDKPVRKPPEPARAEGKGSAPRAAEEPIPAGPAVRRLAREFGIDLAVVAAANPGVRLTEEHLKTYIRELQRRPATAEAAAGGAMEAPPLLDFGKWGAIERVPFTSLQRKTAEHLSLGWSLAPHVTQFDEADITELENMRIRFRETERGKQTRLTVTAFVLKATAVALREHPRFNASLDTAANQLVLKKYYHIGVAVDTPDGLIVPVLRDVDKKSVLRIATEMNELAERTRQRKIGLEELRGGTLTVTNLGGIGGTAFTPVINYPEVAILGLARGRTVPVWRDGQWVGRLMLPLCLSYDHRVINGADGARFVRRLTALLEAPEQLLLEE
ncbi:MAG: hypothetical protein GXY44_07540 [Phycisphaerales bacterium]|nr:hypothetical protein [Phycisphaerales bacterium]